MDFKYWVEVCLGSVSTYSLVWLIVSQDLLISTGKTTGVCKLTCIWTADEECVHIRPAVGLQPTWIQIKTLSIKVIVIFFLAWHLLDCHDKSVTVVNCHFNRFRHCDCVRAGVVSINTIVISWQSFSWYISVICFFQYFSPHKFPVPDTMGRWYLHKYSSRYTRAGVIFVWKLLKIILNPQLYFDPNVLFGRIKHL